MPKPVVQNVQILRFAAASGVVVSHIADLLIPHDPAHRVFWAIPWTAGVDLFFVISGFVMLYLTSDEFGRPGAATRFVRRRLIRIVPPYWFFTTLTVLAVLATGGQLKGTTVDAAQLVTSYAFLPWPRADGKLNPILAQGWTLNYEAFFYAAFTLALVVRRGVAWLVAAFLLLVLAHPLVPARLFMIEFWSRPIILEFLGGIALASIRLAGLRLSRAGSMASVALAAAVFVATGPLWLGGAERLVHLGVPAILLGAGLILRPEPDRPGAIRRLVQRGGDASYTIYLSHYAIINAVALVWRHGGRGSPWIGVAVGIVFSIGFGMIMFERVERPVTERLRRLAGDRRGSRLEEVAP